MSRYEHKIETSLEEIEHLPIKKKEEKECQRSGVRLQKIKMPSFEGEIRDCAAAYALKSCFFAK